MLLKFNPNKLKVLIVGSTGLIGSRLLQKARDLEVYGIRRINKLSNLPKMDYIIHAGGYAQPLKFLQDEIATIKCNTEDLIQLFGKLKKGGKFLYISSSEVYSGLKPPHKEIDIGTTDPSHPRACYIEGKRCGEAICWAYKRMGVDVKIVRLSLTYGATKPGDTRALNYFIEQGKQGKIQLLDKGEAVRTYCYVDDAVDLIWQILLKGKDVVYNVGGVSETTILELACKIGELTNSEVITGDKGLDGAPQNVKLDMTKTLGEFPHSFVSLDEGLRRMTCVQNAP